MKVNRYGTVTLSEGPIRVDGWLIEREPDDPADATSEQLLLAVAIDWARERFDAAVQNAELNVIRHVLKERLKKQKALVQ